MVIGLFIAVGSLECNAVDNFAYRKIGRAVTDVTSCKLDTERKHKKEKESVVRRLNESCARNAILCAGEKRLQLAVRS